MDFSFHIKQGRLLLLKGDPSSIKKAFEHFIAANEMTEEQPMGKPQALYSLALGNFLIGNYDLSYKIAHKAKRSIDTAIQSSWLLTNDMRQMLGEEDIDDLINKIDEDFPFMELSNNKEDENFDENELDFTKFENLNKTTVRKNIQLNYSINSLSDDTIMAVFVEGQSRTNNELVYFDKLEGDVLGHIQGYFTSLTRNQDIEGKRFLNRIKNNEPIDFVDENRYILIDRMPLSKFLDEFKRQTNKKEPFSSYVEYFSINTLKDYSKNDNKSINDLTCSHFIQENFHKLFGEKYQDRIHELKNEYNNIFENTCKSLSIEWLENNIFNEMSENQSVLEYDISSSNQRIENKSDLEEIIIGSQKWSTENLNVSVFQNGDEIPEARTAEEWNQFGKAGNPAWCYYEHDFASGEEYGKLYNWYAVNDPRGLAPNGWQIPTDADWTILTTFLGDQSEVAGKLMETGTDHWENPNNCVTNETGFAALPGGYCYRKGEFDGIGSIGYWWSSSEESMPTAYYRSISSFFGFMGRLEFNKDCGFSVRCLKY